jgi:hypothetical protein
LATFVLLGVTLLGGRAAAEPPRSQVAFSIPSLFPRFSPRIHDYVVRCNDGPVTVDGYAHGAWEVAVRGGAYRQGQFSRRVSLATGVDFTIRVRQVGSPSTTYGYHVRCLPPNFPSYTFNRSGPVSPAFFSLDQEFFVPPERRYAMIFDSHGVPIWWEHRQIRDPRVLPSGQVLWFNRARTRWEIHRLDGARIRTLPAVGHTADPHDLQLLHNGSYLLGAHVRQRHVDTRAYGGSGNADVAGAELQEVSRTGKLLWSWRTKDHVSLDATGRWWPWARRHPAPEGYDIVHWNSIEPDGKSVVASFRHLDAVYKIDKATGDIVWKLGGTTTPESLTVKRDARGYTLGAQHDARVLPDGTVTVFNNRSNLANHTPRAERFRIDAQRRTATLLQSISDPQVSSSSCCGSARRLGNGSWLIDWGSGNPIGGYGPNGQRTFRLSFGHPFSYRAEPVPAGAVSAQDLREAMDAMYAA